MASPTTLPRISVPAVRAAGDICFTDRPNKIAGRCCDTGAMIFEGAGLLAVEFLSGESFRWRTMSAAAANLRNSRGERAIRLSELANYRKIGGREGTASTRVDHRLAARRKGKTLGLGITQTWHHVFAENEKSKLAGDKPMTDEDIAQFMKVEFPELSERSRDVRRVRAERRACNAGTYGYQKLGALNPPSREYDKHGNVVAGSAQAARKPRVSVTVGISEARVRELIAEAQASSPGAPKPVIEISFDRSRKVSVDTAGKHAAFAEVMRNVACGLNVLLVGPKGCGKSHLVKQVAEALKLPFTLNSMSEGISESALLGRVIPDSKGVWHYQESPFVKSYRDGGVHLLDEIDAADPNLLVQINSALANGVLSIPQCQTKPIARHKDSVVIAAANTYGSGADREYVGRNQLDASTLDRFTMATVEVKYDAKLEEAIVKAIVGDSLKATQLLKLMWEAREKTLAHRLRRGVSTRNIEDAAKKLRGGFSLKEIMTTFFQSWSADEKSKVIGGGF